jgi:hypothetical protein
MRELDVRIVDQQYPDVYFSETPAVTESTRLADWSASTDVLTQKLSEDFERSCEASMTSGMVLADADVLI